ncbi:GNAT family N-acetyltransferase [Penaeicola halotolerans]|uniref:GNAT family N-acetyltransferase n=1 Tax=Penaeicola halotolerans TaxID=2793196 RepID=UPI001CF9107C|nr:GNAT family N-acetyltransferase [Penaeicola halotolerans]
MIESERKSFDFQPILSNTLVKLVPLQKEDLDKLYAVASDPLIWEQHPNKSRYQRPVFEKFFEGAMASGGAFLIHDAATGQVIGSTRFYDWDAHTSSVFIGYTFIDRLFWGKGYNLSIKQLMASHAFEYVARILFHIGAENLRSQRSIVKTGAHKIGEEVVAYYGEPDKLNFVYELKKEDFDTN